MKNSLQLKLSQHLALTPQLQQSIKLLQLSTLELNQELEKFLMDNPLLERAEGWNEDTPAVQAPIRENGPLESGGELNGSSAASEEGTAPSENWEMDDSWTPDGQSGTWRDGDEDGEYPPQAAAAPSLIDHLLSQLRIMNLSERDFAIASLLIAHLDEEGYLGTSLEEILAMRSELADADADELQIALRLIQSLDPVGVGARSLAECLAIQIAALPASTEGRACALQVARSHLPLLANRDYLRLKKQLGCDDTSLRLAQKLIAQCNPRPAADFNISEARYVVPDVVVRKVRTRWLVSLNPDAMPKLRINRMYADILNRSREHGGQMSAQLQEARWLIKNVQQRFETILKVSQAIVERQRHFFEHGEVAMRPLVLREIADTVGLHESTVSRVTTQKFMLTPRGIFELKYFFSSHVGTDTGGAASSTAIRALIKQLISAEDCRKPLSDSRISDILGQQGIVVARRTVAKYREAMQIHPASQRKSL